MSRRYENRLDKGTLHLIYAVSYAESIKLVLLHLWNWLMRKCNLVPRELVFDMLLRKQT